MRCVTLPTCTQHIPHHKHADVRENYEELILKNLTKGNLFSKGGGNQVKMIKDDFSVDREEITIRYS